MKKALTFLSFLAGNVMITSAQVTGAAVTGTLNGTQISVGIGGNGGVQAIGVGAAAGTVNGGPLLQLLAVAQTLVSRLGIFAVGLAVVVFFWYLIKFIISAGSDPTQKDASIKGMGYSILALFVMVSIWGIIGVMGNALGVNQGGDIPIPGIPVPCSAAERAAGAC